MVSMLKKIFGGIFVFLVVLVLIGAFVDDDGGGGSDYNAWLKERCPNCIFEKEQRYEAVDFDGEDRELFLKTFKISYIERTYKLKDEYKPEQEWERRETHEYIVTLLSMPKGVEKVWVQITDNDTIGIAVAEFNFSSKGTQREFNYFGVNGFFISSSIAKKSAYITFKEVK